jgi:Domain of unknown function (DUF397)
MTAAASINGSEPTDGRWRKAKRSMAADNNCVEVKFDGEMVLVRDSKNPTGPSLCFTRSQWRSLLATIGGRA